MKQFIRTRQTDGLVEHVLKNGDTVEIGFNNQSIRLNAEVEFISKTSTGHIIFLKTNKTHKIVISFGPAEAITALYSITEPVSTYTDTTRNSAKAFSDPGFYICKVLRGSKSEISTKTLKYSAIEKRIVNVALKVGDVFDTIKHKYQVLAISADGAMFCNRIESDTGHVFRPNDESLVNSMCGVDVGEPNEE